MPEHAHMAKTLKISDFPELSQRDFLRLSQFIHEKWGINLPPIKKLLLEGRLRKRILQLRMKSFKEYCEYLFSPDGSANEYSQLIDLVTTNKTEFFREKDHFDYLVEFALPTFRGKRLWRQIGPLQIWCAGCSSGEEPYTLAMILSEFTAASPDFSFSILASDISSKVLSVAKSGIYDESRTCGIPLEYKEKYLLRSKDRSLQVVRFIPAIRSKIKFERVNLMEMNASIRQIFHIIFCRNVIIYFDKANQEKVLKKYYDYLAPGGYLFLGHSETLTGLKIPFIPVAPTVYRKPGE